MEAQEDQIFLLSLSP